MQVIPHSQLQSLKEIDGGGFGFVYKAKHKQYGTVVYKELDIRKLRDEYAQFVLFELDSIYFNVGYILSLVRCVHIAACVCMFITCLVKCM